MKKTVTIYMLIFALFACTVNAYASFPVKKTKKAVVTSVNASNEEVSEKSEFAVVTASSGKSQIIAAVLAWFVGIFGIHRFYLGYIWQGVVQLLTLGGLGIWAFIDFIRILIGDLQPKDGSYSKTI